MAFLWTERWVAAGRYVSAGGEGEAALRLG